VLRIVSERSRSHSEKRQRDDGRAPQKAISLSRTFTIASSVAEASASSRRAQRPKPKGTDPILSRVPRREADTGENGDQHSGPVVEQSQNSY
jgi:hypothetical protein